MTSSPESLDLVLAILAVLILGGGVMMLLSSMFDLGGRL